VSVIARRVLRRFTRPRIEPLPAQVFGTFEREDKPPLELLDGYRDVLKPTWRLTWWPTRVLFELRSCGSLPDEYEPLARSLLSARTLSRPLATYAAAVAAVEHTQPDAVVRTGRTDRALGVEILERPAQTSELDAIAGYYRRYAEQMGELLASHGVGLEGARILEIGCGTGFLTFSLAGVGAREAVGVDLELEGYVAASDRASMFARLRASGRARLQEADAARLPFEDGSFDAVVSRSALEHMRDLGAVLAETRRVLRPGGVSLHTVHPWFAPNGGHAQCSLDAPWAHVRLDEREFARYLAAWRPHEKDDAQRSYAEDFQSPRLTIAETQALVERSGYEILAWEPTGPDRRHARVLTSEIVDGCRARWPKVTRDDLLTPTYTIVARRIS